MMNEENNKSIQGGMEMNGFGACGMRIMAIRRQMIHDGVPASAVTREMLESQIADLVYMGECDGEALWPFDEGATNDALNCIFATSN